MKWIGKFFKSIIYGIVVISFLFVAFAVISGNTYLFFLLKNTVFKGRLGPDLDEYSIYENRRVEASDGVPWQQALINAELNEQDRMYNEANGTVAFLVIKNDKIIWEYYNEEHSDTFHYNIWSAAKSIVGLLVGCAIDDGYIKSVNQPIEDFYPHKYQGSGITIEHLLTMSSGINFTESYINPFSYAARHLYDDDIESLLDNYEPEATPGEVFDYKGGDTQLLAMIIAKQSGKSISEYASEKIWKPVHAMQDAFWSLDHKGGVEKASCCFNTNARDFARLGKLAMNRGVWEGDTLINPAFFDKALRPSELKNEDGSICQSYGYQWWILNLDAYQGYYARGIQGQYVFVIPQEDLIVVRLGHKRNTSPDRQHITDVFRYIDMGRSIAAQSR